MVGVAVGAVAVAVQTETAVAGVLLAVVVAEVGTVAVAGALAAVVGVKNVEKGALLAVVVAVAVAGALLAVFVVVAVAGRVGVGGARKLRVIVMKVRSVVRTPLEQPRRTRTTGSHAAPAPSVAVARVGAACRSPI